MNHQSPAASENRASGNSPLHTRPDELRFHDFLKDEALESPLSSGSPQSLGKAAVLELREMRGVTRFGELLVLVAREGIRALEQIDAIDVNFGGASVLFRNMNRRFVSEIENASISASDIESRLKPLSVTPPTNRVDLTHLTVEQYETPLTEFRQRHHLGSQVLEKLSSDCQVTSFGDCLQFIGRYGANALADLRGVETTKTQGLVTWGTDYRKSAFFVNRGFANDALILPPRKHPYFAQPREFVFSPEVMELALHQSNAPSIGSIESLRSSDPSPLQRALSKDPGLGPYIREFGDVKDCAAFATHLRWRDLPFTRAFKRKFAEVDRAEGIKRMMEMSLSELAEQYGFSDIDYEILVETLQLGQFVLPPIEDVDRNTLLKNLVQTVPT